MNVLYMDKDGKCEKLYTGCSDVTYLYRIASSGLSPAARRAGKTPVKKPTTAENAAMKSRNGIGNENNETDFPPKFEAAKIFELLFF
jgi:hypothetical protein